MPRPVCVNCQIEYRPEKNDVVAEEMASFGSYKLWSADLWKCPKCGHLLVTGFGHQPFLEHYQAGYPSKVASVTAPIYRFYENPDPKEAA